MHEPSGALHSLEKQWKEDSECVNMNENRTEHWYTITVTLNCCERLKC